MRFQLAITTLLLASCFAFSGQAAERPNILIVTVDDMSADSLGAFGCKLKDTSPNIDAFAKTALRFQHAHVLVGNCMPGRNIMWSGLYSHINGVEGFRQNPNPDYPALCDLAKEAGYFAAIRGKVAHSTPYTPYAWDAVLDNDPNDEKYSIKDVASYGRSTAEGIRRAKDMGKPFCMLVNISDPHKPFYAGAKDKFQPSRVFNASEVPVPGFLPSDDVIKEELALYYSSVRRADDCFQSIMAALKASGEVDNTFVMFLSDHGMPLPFAKTQLYYHSTHTPLMIRWPGVTKPDSVDEKHMVSVIDFVPTLLDIMQHKHPKPDSLQGRSFATILHGEEQNDRDAVILQYNENSGRFRHPMRGIQTRNMLYLYNPWSDGKRKFATATTGTATYRQIVKRAKTESDIAARLQLLDHRVVDELYNTKDDPDCLNNLIDKPAMKTTVAALRLELAEALRELKDPVAPLLASHEDVTLREEYMAAEDEKTKTWRANRSRRKRTKKKLKVITLETPDSVQRGERTSITIHHQLPKTLGQQKLHVTLKANNNRRIRREVVVIEGIGSTKVEFDVPDVQQVQFAAFVGETYETNVQHVTTAAIPSK